MKNGSWIARWALLLLVAAMPATAQILEPCKNHFILSWKCEPPPAVDVAIGPAGAVALDAQGNLYFSSINIVFRLGDGVLTRVAGDGRAGFSGDGGPARDALLHIPEWYDELAIDPIDFDPLVGPLVLDAAGNLYIADAYNSRVRKVGADGIISTVAGSGDGLGPTDHLWMWWTQGLAIDATGLLLVTDTSGKLRRIRHDGTHEILVAHNCSDPLKLGLCNPRGLATDARGNTFVVDGTCQIRRISASGEWAIVAGDPRRNNRFAYPCDFSGDGGPAIDAALARPYSVAVDGLGNLYIADTYNHCIRKVDGDGRISTVAGICVIEGFSGDGGPATEARLNRPYGIAVDAGGNLYIADSLNRRIRKVTPNGLIETIAGNGQPLPQ